VEAERDAHLRDLGRREGGVHRGMAGAPLENILIPAVIRTAAERDVHLRDLGRREAE